MNKAWLRDWPWETITAINSGLCKKKNALHKPTSEGHELARKLWGGFSQDQNAAPTGFRDLSALSQALPFLLLQRKHVRGRRPNNDQDVLRKLTPIEAQVFRSVVGHYIAGTAGDKELDDTLAALE